MSRHEETLNAIDSAELRVIDALRQTGSLTQAAQMLGLSQPAVSQRVKRIETRLQVPVIERSGRGIRLTPAGLVLAKHARIVVAELDEALAAIEDLRGERAGTLRLVGFPSASATIVPGMMRLLRRDAPSVTMEYREAEPPEAGQMLREGIVDAALIFEYAGAPDRIPGTTFTPLWKESMSLVVGREHHSVNGVANLEDFAGAEWIAGCQKCRGYLLTAAHDSGFEPIIIQETDNVPAMMAMAAAGGSVAMVPGLALAAARTLPDGAVALPIEPARYRTIGLLSIATNEESPAVLLARRLLSQVESERWGLVSLV